MRQRSRGEVDHVRNRAFRYRKPAVGGQNPRPGVAAPGNRRRWDELRFLRGQGREGIGSVPGVEQASVNLATERASVLARPSLEPSAVVDAVRQAGYGVASETVDLDVQGMNAFHVPAKVKVR